jgi:hypothetical protein
MRLAPNAAALVLQYRKKPQTVVRLLHVSKPIGASFFLHAIPSVHRHDAARLIALAAIDQHGGGVLARLLAPDSAPRPPRLPPPRS